MGFFSKILEKLGFAKEAAAQDAVPADKSHAATMGAQASVAVPTVDVVAQLEQKASDHPERLNWKTSIVDLLKLLGLDSSLSARKELAVELGCPPEKMNDSAQMNMWLHKAVLQRLAENGGNIPPELLD